MAPIYEAFRGYGGPWIAVLLALTWIAFARLPDIKDTAERLVTALSQPWLMKTAICVALLSWIWSFVRLFLGDAYLRGSGEWQELSTILLGLILVLAAVAWRGISWRRRSSHFRRWVTHGLVLVLIVSSGGLLLEAPEEKLAQGKQNDRHAVAFAQKRLAKLDCFGASRPAYGEFEAPTALAVISFQMANDFDPQTDLPGTMRVEKEFRLLARPFPFFFGPKHCLRERHSGGLQGVRRRLGTLPIGRDGLLDEISQTVEQLA